MLIVALVLVVVHFSLVFFYALPIQPKNKLTFFSQVYVYPFFHQNWSLFAPVPDSNYRLFVNYKKDGVQKKDLFTEIVTRHQTNRLAGYGPLVLALSNSIHYFEKNTTLVQKLNGPIRQDEYFLIIEHAVKNYLINTEKIEPQKIQIMLLVEHAKTKKQRIYFN